MEALKRIMHVEDDDSIRMITSITLESVGNMEVKSCESGFLALEQFEEFQPQVILMDVMMPELDGPETLKRMMASFDLSSIMVVFMTAKVQEDEVAHFKAIGGFDVIEKPFDPMTLSEKIQACWTAFHGRLDKGKRIKEKG